MWGLGGRGKGRERRPGADSAPGCEWGVGEGGDEETRVCPSLLRVKRVQAVTVTANRGQTRTHTQLYAPEARLEEIVGTGLDVDVARVCL